MSKKIESKAYRLIKPGQFEEMMIEHDFSDKDIIVKPTKASVCHADLRYYTGNRRPEALKKKLPMALFHEGIGIVEASNHEDIKIGDKVVIVPNIPSRLQKGEFASTDLQDNYDENALFMGSGFDGICQSKLVIHGDNVVKIPSDLDEDVALLAELCSVSLFPINQLQDITTKNSPKVAVFGDGPVGYLSATALHFIHGIEKENLIVFGAVEEKLKEFNDFATTHLVFDYDFTNESGVHTVFECTGGKFSESAINQAIDLIDRQGQIVLMGVTEDLVGINTRDVLEKGLTLSGSSRSTKKEFEQLISHFDNPNYQKALRKLIPETYYDIREIKDLNRAMDDAAAHKGWKKTYLKYNW
ncbi:MULTISPECIES: alcohol dehydrogenase catalytic domain-containing protein [unclassified Staphylococcus]|uniref:alcohol dehydrogenase catalytic domain-containing protein n=1 Tax=unclassified Staphylococcus TaxID=91994 RepID=UPI0021D398AE|nr:MULTISPECIES: alcohol dehydrogenase catalytic domain-containing protein [unclassified Staphylococcus]UXR70975.1 alcohol dehydrogenase catalytic domain-containing protein [Staphylococcus sp. IVB6240]UXR73203.1 alcohol dehydrogenase catalytic domain-containing protein [Staphylococcus sp. IVB6238]UXR75501.1 alcohol dehydrogenase catalytic domain-containing protein [Staphylococcus sp. IVB6233]UXR79703.1 alcohol dehydrogenase catalytic domain-containing protein [Staphylococcus sp. IVB6218]